MARKIVKKVTDEVKSLLVGLLIGDGTISNNYVFKLSHCIEQKEFLEWKVKQLNDAGLKNNGIKEYISSAGYNVGKPVVYSQLSIIPTIKAMRRSIYIPKKKITRNLLNRLDARGIAIWYMDDGHININESVQRGNSVQKTIKIATCLNEEDVNIVIDYFQERWGIKFRKFLEGKNTYSIGSSTAEDCSNFIKIVEKYVKQIPTMLYKIRESSTKANFKAEQLKTAVSKHEISL